MDIVVMEVCWFASNQKRQTIMDTVVLEVCWLGICPIMRKVTNYVQNYARA